MQLCKDMAQLLKQRAPTWHQKVQNGKFATGDWSLGGVQQDSTHGYTQEHTEMTLPPRGKSVQTLTRTVEGKWRPAAEKIRTLAGPASQVLHLPSPCESILITSRRHGARGSTGLRSAQPPRSLAPPARPCVAPGAQAGVRTPGACAAFAK